MTMKKNNYTFLKYETLYFSILLYIIGAEIFLIPIYYYTDLIYFLIGALLLPILISISVLISKELFIIVEVSNEGITWKLFGKSIQQLKWIDVEHIDIKPKMMNISILFRSIKQDEILYFNGGKMRLEKVLGFCPDEELRKKLHGFIS